MYVCTYFEKFEDFIYITYSIVSVNFLNQKLNFLSNKKNSMVFSEKKKRKKNSLIAQQI